MRHFLVSLLLCLPVPVFAQSAGGFAGLTGVVRDASGAAVPNAKVVISSVERGQLRSLSTNDAGAFAAPSLNPGPGYQVTVDATGFSTYEMKGIDLQVGQNLSLDVTVTVAQAATQVEVSAAATLVNDTKTDVSQVIGSRDISNLPINGRRVDQFVLNTPGVTNDGTFGLLTFRGVEGNNSFLLDGNDNTDQFYNENAGRTRIQSQISADAVQEFQVISSNVSAEYGRAMGGVVNTVTKSGTNELHGGAFYYLRSTGFNARDPYATFTPAERRYQTGAFGGGALKKDKLFLFLSSDITRRDFPMADSQVKVGVINPSTQSWVGCGAPATPAQCQAINTLLPRFYGQIPRTADNDLYFGRLDYHLSDKNTFSVSFNFLRWLSPNGIQTGVISTTGAAINGNGDDSVTVRNGKATWTFVPNGSFINNFRYGFNSDRQADSFNQGTLGAGLNYLNVMVGGVQLGPANYLPRIQPMETRNEIADDATWIKGNHSIKFGLNVVRTHDNVTNLINRFGAYTYLTPTDFAQDYTGGTGVKHWSSYTQAFGNPFASFGIRELGFYLQDQWRVNNRLTLTLGGRYEHSFSDQPPTANWDWPQTGNIHTGTMNVMPRIGIAYRLNDKTVFRGGFGTYFARLVAGMVDNALVGNGLYQVSATFNSTNAGQFAAGPVFPNALGAPPAGTKLGASTLQFFAPNLKTPYTEQGSLALERQFSHDMVLTVSGIWSHGVNLYGVTDVNAPEATKTVSYRVNDASGNQTGTFTTPVYLNPRPNPKYGAVLETTNGVSSYYAGLAVTFEKRFTHGLSSLASYTWAHAIDDGQGTSTNAVFSGSTSIWTYNGNYSFDKGSSLIDQRHRFTLALVWAPTFTRNDGAFFKYVVNNWQISGIGTLAAGRPTGSGTVRMTDTPVPGMLSSNSLNGFGGNNRVPFLPVNGLYTPASYRGDVRITKNIPLPLEQLRIALNFEAFNVSNSWSPTSLTTQVYTEKKSTGTPYAGVLTLTPAAFNVGSADGGFPDGTQARRLQVSVRLTF